MTINLKVTTGTGASLKFVMRHGDLSDMRQGYFLNSTGDMGFRISGDMRPGYLRLLTGDRAVLLATVTCDRGAFKI